jgi:hypothetical protein
LFFEQTKERETPQSKKLLQKEQNLPKLMKFQRRENMFWPRNQRKKREEMSR